MEGMCFMFCSLNDTNVFSVVVFTLWLSYLLWKRLLSTSSPCIVLHSCGLTCRIILNMFDRDQYRAAGGICVPYSQSPSGIQNEPQIGQQSNYPKQHFLPAAPLFLGVMVMTYVVNFLHCSSTTICKYHNQRHPKKHSATHGITRC